MPTKEPLIYTLEQWVNEWKKTLQPCEIDGKELANIKLWVNSWETNNPIDITDIVEEKVCETYKIDECNSRFTCCNKPKQLVFKQPTEKQVDGEIEAVEFLEWTLSAGFKLNPHCEQNRWNHIDKINSNNPILNDGFTTKQLYEIFKNR